MSAQPPPTSPSSAGGAALVTAVFIAAICGLVYELIAGTLSSYLLGDTVTQFSLVIGLFLTAMGAGSFLSRYIQTALFDWFVFVEISVGLIGGMAALVGFAAFAYTELYQPALLAIVALVGILVGLEIPIVIRLLRDLTALRVTLANVLSADYLGALVASVLFPFALLPHLGLVRAGMAAGLANVFVGAWVLWRFRGRMRRAAAMARFAILASMLLAGGMVLSERLVTGMESRLYQDEIILALDTPYQRIVLTRWRDDVRLFLNGHLQFASVDEYRYHEALVLPAMAAAAPRPARVLILGGGDGLAAREVLRHEGVEHIDLVDIDPQVTHLFRTRPVLTALNGNALNDPRVRIHHEDAFAFIQRAEDFYDVILIDLPDPSVPGLSKLYSEAFYGLVGRRLTAGGALACQSTSPFRSRSAFWCIVHTLAAARWGPEGATGLEVRPYHADVPTFGDWGFVLAGPHLPPVEELRIRPDGRYLTSALLPSLFVFPPDTREIPTGINRLNDPIIVKLYERGYHKYFD